MQTRSTIRLLRRLILARVRRAWPTWVRRSIGWIWLALWAAVIDLLHRPWHELGGLLSERMRWLERFVLGAAFLVGCFVGSFVRDAAQTARWRPHLDSLRFVWIPPASLVAVTLGVLHGLDLWPWTLLVLVSFAAYWAGLDASVGAWPMARGRHYCPTGPIEADPHRAPATPELELDD